MLSSLLVLCGVWNQAAAIENSGLSIDATTYQPLFSERGEHSWDAVHKSFYVRTFTTGETYHHRLSFDVPWSGFRRLFTEDAFYQALLKQFDAIDQLPREQMESAPAVRRLIFFRDLWTLFEKLNDRASNERGQELRQRIARIMKRLELSDTEIAQLPDTLAEVRARKLFADSPDPNQREKPYLPTSLLEQETAWIALATQREFTTYDGLPRSAPFHAESVNHRSLFSIHIRSPNGRNQGEEFIANNGKQGVISFPPGTELALLRRAVAANREGHLKVTNVVESLQLLVTPTPDVKQDARFKFVLDRSEFLAGKPGLIPLQANTPVDAFSFESTGQWLMRSTSDADGEILVLGRGKGHVGVPSMQHCVACHGHQNRNFFANFPAFFVFPTTNAKLAGHLETQKADSESWKAYLQLRGKP